MGAGIEICPTKFVDPTKFVRLISLSAEFSGKPFIIGRYGYLPNEVCMDCPSQVFAKSVPERAKYRNTSSACVGDRNFEDFASLFDIHLHAWYYAPNN